MSINIITTTEITTMSHDVARAATERIRNAVSSIMTDLTTVYSQQGFLSLGYKSMTAYMVGEFPEISGDYLHKQLQAGRTINNLHNTSTMVEPIKERVIRPLAKKKYINKPKVQNEIWNDAKAHSNNSTPRTKDVKAAVIRYERKRTQEVAVIPTTPDCSLFVSDISNLHNHIKPASIDYIITDPPYPKEFLYLYESLAEFAMYTLKPGGSLLAMAGQSHVIDVLNLLSIHLNYQWIVSYLTPGGQSPQIWPRKVNSFWKPVLWFVKGKYTGRWIGDVNKSAVNDNDKQHHHWGQSESGIANLINRFTDPGHKICDPFVGGGTTAVVSVRLERRFIGADIDSNAINITAKRLANETG